MASFNPTPAEIALTSLIFAAADPQKLGIITGDAAVNILSGANLSHTVLGEIWAIADKDNNGFLTRKGLSIALRLIGYAQQGETVKEVLVDTPGPLASIEGFAPPLAARPPPSLNPVSQPSPSPSTTTFPPLSQQDKTKFLKLFIGCGPVNGLLSGEKARDVFVKSKLSYDKLSHIWMLADSNARGALDSSDFTVGMYLIQACMSSPSFTLPAVLPKWVYDQITDHSAGISSHTTGGSSGLGSPLHSAFQSNLQNTTSGMTKLGANAIKTQTIGPYTLPASGLIALPTSTTASPNPMVKNIQSSQSWAISAEEKSSSDTMFDGLDIQRRGFIEGDVAVPFMLTSNLPGDELAQIWDLADLDNDGHLTRDGFAIAMYLINLRIAGGDIPSILPQTLVPPSRQSHPPATAANKQVDLLLGESPPASPSQSPPNLAQSSLSPQATGQNGFMSPVQRTSTQHQTLQSTFSNPSKDLLGDDDDTRNNVLPDTSVEIGNVQNQLSSTNRSLESTKNERASVEQTTLEQDMQLSQLQTQLALARASYETESQLLNSLRERSAAQRADIRETREELIRAESDLSAVKVEKAEVERSVLKAKEEIRDLQRRMKETISQTDQLKAQMEKLRKDARQQKGLLAIAKKQLATAEIENLKTSKERDVAQSELEIVQTEKAAVDTQVAEPPSTVSAAASIADSSIEIASTDRAVSPVQPLLAATVPLPATPQSTTPRPVSRQSTNPFERLALAAVNSDSTRVFHALSPSNSDTTPSILPEFPLLPTVESNVNSQAITDPLHDSTLSMAGTSHSDDEALFLTPPTTANPLNSETDELRVEASKTAASTAVDDGLGRLPYSNKMNPPFRDTHNKPSEDYLDPSQRPHSPVAITSDTLVSPSAPTPTKKSPPVSRKSSPNRNRSPGGTFVMRTPSSHSSTGIVDHFGPSNFSTPLEPLANGTPPPIIETVLEPPALLTNASTISDFDEAFGKFPNSALDAASTFKFGSAFDDNFDFASAVGVSDQSVEPMGNIHSAETDPNTIAPSTPFSHIGASLTKDVNQSIGPTISNEGVGFSPAHPTDERKFADHSNGKLTVTFDDGFGSDWNAPTGLQQIEKDVTSGTFNTVHIPPASNMNINPFPVIQAEPQVDRTTSPQPTSPVEQPASSPIRPLSSQQPLVTIGTSRTASPPPRVSSPRLRGNSKGTSDNKPESSKHKLSLRFPFGRKDKSKDKEEKSKDKEDRRGQSHTQQIPSDTSHFLAPVSESTVPGAVTPAVEDDAEPVKQLAAMGFSRTQSIAALETHGYDVQAALNSLLGAA
ncbi:hypothetical protein BU17DRAFT_55537 [Hysterangium stoloniferum]|nr:hypothetical protein BU17DRAFT_55537 [Hysterangium stoloniferum]